ncbi:hypothetical protein AK812_SmicGene7907 [Symbiodinium microadriaticum]|uniref:Uncharacterized protein n=1 Tax=Symbiodinium microadriaticum TaxID=2951 RepID=A0A1Q9EME4_SYMMI|nr:hypothetical protein AK812_SmicGene7907 [Symbiodinium microadriaticum]
MPSATDFRLDGRQGAMVLEEIRLEANFKRTLELKRPWNARDCPAIGQAAEAALSRYRFAIKLLFAALGVALLQPSSEAAETYQMVCLLRADTLPGQPGQRTADAKADVNAEAVPLLHTEVISVRAAAVETRGGRGGLGGFSHEGRCPGFGLSVSAPVDVPVTGGKKPGMAVVDTRAKHEAKKETVSSIFVVDDGPEDYSTFCMGEGGGAFVTCHVDSSDNTTVTGTNVAKARVATWTNRNMTAADAKGLAIDDTTFSQCPSLALTMLGVENRGQEWRAQEFKTGAKEISEPKWPNTHNRISSVYEPCLSDEDSSWDGKYDRQVAEGPKPKEATSKTWRNDEEQRKLTEVALLSPVAAIWFALREYIWCFYKKPRPDAIPESSPVKELMEYIGWYYTMGSWADHPVYTWNVYPYFDPNVQVNPADPAACGKVLWAAQSFAADGMITTQLRS